MSSITVKNLDDSVKAGLRLRAARHGGSIEQQVRQILPQTVASEEINQRFAGLQAQDLPLPVRAPGRTPPELE